MEHEGLIFSSTFLLNPAFCYILLLLGIYAILFEFTLPGFGIPGLLGLALIGCAVYLMRLNAVEPVGLVLIAAGILLFIFEAFVTAGIGLLAIAGGLIMGTGSVLLFGSTSRLPYPVVIFLTLLTGFITVFLVRSAIRSQRMKIISGKEGMTGATVEIHTSISPGKPGKVLAQGTIWNAVSDENISCGEKAEIVSVDGTTIKVKKIN